MDSCLYRNRRTEVDHVLEWITDENYHTKQDFTCTDYVANVLANVTIWREIVWQVALIVSTIAGMIVVLYKGWTKLFDDSQPTTQALPPPPPTPSEEQAWSLLERMVTKREEVWNLETTMAVKDEEIARLYEEIDRLYEEVARKSKETVKKGEVIVKKEEVIAKKDEVIVTKDMKISKLLSDLDTERQKCRVKDAIKLL